MKSSPPLERGSPAVPISTQPLGNGGSSLREKIIEAAYDAVKGGGVASVTMRSLAERLGYSAATLYLHFASKAELLEEVAQLGFEELGQALESCFEADDPEQVLRETSRRYLEFARQNAALYDVMFDRRTGAPETEPDGDDAAARLWRRCRVAFEDGVREGIFRDQDAGTAMLLQWASLHGLVQLQRAGRLPDAGSERGGALREAVAADRIAALRASAA